MFLEEYLKKQRILNASARYQANMNILSRVEWSLCEKLWKE